VAAIPVLGAVATGVANVGLNILGMTRPPSFNTPPEKLSHYSDVSPDIIMKEGLNPPSGMTYGTNLSNLNPQQAQSALNINK
jgi:hypothetical protein